MTKRTGSWFYEQALTELEAQYAAVLGGEWVRRYPDAVGEACLVWRREMLRLSSSKVIFLADEAKLGAIAYTAVVAAITKLFPRSTKWDGNAEEWNDARHRKVGHVLAVLEEARLMVKQELADLTGPPDSPDAPSQAHSR